MTDLGDRPKRKALLSWSSGKDSAWALHVLRRRGEVDVVGLITTVNEVHQRIAMHAVRVELLERQAQALGLPIWQVPIPSPCTNAEYEERMAALLVRAAAAGVTAVAFGDLFLEDIRRYREERMHGTGIEPLFPLWASSTDTLAREMIAAGLRARITCVDPKQLARSFAGREFDERLLADLPGGADPCGERGEFHTFAYAGPMFAQPIAIASGPIVERDGFVFADLFAATGPSDRDAMGPPG